MAYTNVYPSRINWENEPSIASPINATNLNKLDYAAYEFDQTFETWDVTKANQSDLLLSVKEINYDDETGVFVFTWQNGTTKTVDLNIEKIPVSFSMSPQGVITMTTDDGTTYTADVGALIKTYTFTDSSEIDFTVTTDSSGNKTVTASIVAGSITGSKLEPNYLANCQSAANSASASATTAGTKAQDSEAWAVGERGGVPVGPTDPAYENNAKWYAEHGTGSSLAGLSDTDITSPTDGQVLSYDGTKWINKDAEAGGGSTIIVGTNEVTLRGQTCTITDGVTTLTETINNSGVATFKGVTLTGTLTITATDGVDTAQRTIDVPYFGNYTATLSFFSATITVTYPASGTCTISDGSTTLTATSNPMAFVIPNTGTWTAKATVDGIEKSGTPISITTDGQTATDTIVFGTINLTYDNEFRGLTLTCTDSSYTITKTAPSTGNTMVFYPNETNTWTISGTYSGVTYTTTAEVSSLSTPVSAILQTIPNGSTATPTDVVQTWLKCATINDKSYTTLNEVLADTDTFTALLQDSNACDYMARSTTWSTTICADADAMARVGKYDYCSEKLLSNATWAEAIAESEYFESVLDTKVPTMTSNTTPSGEAFARGAGNNTPAWKAFDQDDSTGWDDSSNISPSYIGYDFGYGIKILKVDIKQTYTRIRTYKIQGSNDRTDWTDLTETLTLTEGQNKFSIVLTKNIAIYRYYRFYSIDNDSNCALSTLQFYGRHSSEQYSPLVPVMTSNTTPSGEVIGTGIDGFSDTNLYQIFTGDTSETAGRNASDVGYKFAGGEKKVVKRYSFVNAYYASRGWYGIGTYKIQGLQDDDTWTDLTDTLNAEQNITVQYHDLDNNVAYKGYRLVIVASSYPSGMSRSVCSLQFYAKIPSTTQIHSCPNDTLYVMNNGSPEVICTTGSDGVGEIDWEDFEAGVYTIYSSVAKDPNNLSNDYGKSVRVTKTQYGHTTDAYIMPDAVKTLYWYGKKLNLQNPGKSTSAYTKQASDESTNYISVSGQASNVVKSISGNNLDIDKITIAKCIVNPSTVYGTKSGLTLADDNNVDDHTSVSNTGLQLLTVQKTKTFTNPVYIAFEAVISNRVANDVYALWYE